MAAPQLTLKAEPLEAAKVVYLRMAPNIAGGKARGRLFLRVDIRNNEAKTVTVKTLTISFPGSSVPSQVKNIAKDVGSTKTLRWWFPEAADDIIFDLPAPTQIKLAIACQGFDRTADVTLGLAAHVSPVVGGAYVFPAAGEDLAIGEFWQMNGCTHGVGSEGSQSFAYDMGVWGIDHDTGSYSWAKPGTDGSSNDEHRIWGKPVRAMADGIVLEAVNDCPNNPAPLKWSTKEELDAKMKEQKDKFWGTFPHGGAGNHLYVQHGDEVVLYAHLQKGSLAGTVLAAGAKVKAGQLLGRAGNSGNSTAPHLHIHAVQGTSPETGPMRPFVLRDAWAIDNDLIIADPRKGLWAPIAQAGIPEGSTVQWDKKDSFVWPAKTLPDWPEVVKLGVPETQYQKVFNDMHANGLRPAWINAYTLEPLPGAGLTYFDLIFRPATGLVYEARHGMSGNGYQQEFDTWVKQKGYRLAHVESYYSHANDRVSYAAIFQKSAGPAFTAYHGKSKAEHQALLEDLTKNKGFIPVAISVVSRRGDRFYTALYEKRNVGSWEARSTLSAAEYQQKFTDNANRGLDLAYLNAYLHGGDLNFIAIWHENIPSPFVRHHLDSGEFDGNLRAQRKAGRYLRCVTGYQRGLAPNWGAIWNT